MVEAPREIGRIRKAIRKTGVAISRVGMAVGVVGVAGIVTQAGSLSEADHNIRIEATTQFPPLPQEQIDKALLELRGSNFASGNASDKGELAPSNANLTPSQQNAAEVIVFNTIAEANRAAFVRAANQTPTHRRLEGRVDTAINIAGWGATAVVAGLAVRRASHIRKPQYTR